MSFSELTLRLLIAFFVLILLTRIMGRKEIGQMTFFNFVSAISLGTIGASLAIDKTFSIAYGLYALVVWAILTIVMGYLDIKSKKLRLVLDGDPIILIKDGKVMDEEMRKARIDLDVLKAMLRKKNAFSISEVDYAILETDGKISVSKKEANQPLTKKGLASGAITSPVFPTTTEIISDGKVLHKNLDKLHVTDSWLEQQLQQAGVNKLSDVFYAEVQKDGTLYIDQVKDS
ncbi:DUF421 domain-containing protein [Pontibacillus sp. HN14]|uniref:DUF421 domain-containing protein n=1 Tax=Pontibacillus chungwhensis TaxID=265426 RepID=A0ABY8V648_9BACI|nr:MULTISPECIES: DUF421 domain-containing protein [Pontibacillus]MCD5324375.1 DUF421 domain-containing protein [Pontibacillus sp. HN14]WIF99326.1 DUF421 domain-containing protein [Pontibacillus chungwhensis]